MFDYEAWIDRQTETARFEIQRLSLKGIYDESAWLAAADGAEPGSVIVAQQRPANAHAPLVFPGHGKRIAAVPTSALRSLLWEVCRRMPIIPVDQR